MLQLGAANAVRWIPFCAVAVERLETLGFADAEPAAMLSNSAAVITTRRIIINPFSRPDQYGQVRCNFGRSCCL